MPVNRAPRVGYVVKVYPRLSQTFILNEILAHQEAGSPVDLFSLRLPDDGRFHAALARVEAPAVYFPATDLDAASLWREIGEAGAELPALWETLRGAAGIEPREIAQAIGVARAARRNGIDHLHAHFGNVAAEVARLAASMAGVTYSFTAHARDIFHENVRSDDLRRKLARAAAVATVSRFNVDHLVRTFGDAAARVELIYNGLDLDGLTYAEPSEREALIVGVGRLIAKKGFEDLIEACALLAREGREFRCEIIGGGPLETALRERVERLGLRGRVELSGARPSEEVLQTISRARVLAAPCLVAEDGDRDGLPTVLLEAMALGTPCVATDVTGIPEAIVDEETGLMVRQRSPEDVAGACARLLDDSALRCRLARAARRLVERQFDVRINASRLRGLFERAVAHGRNESVAGVER